MKKRMWSKAVSIFTAILLVVGFVPNMTVAVMAAEEIKELCQNHNIPVELIQCRVNEIETYMDGVHLICTTAKVDRSFGDIPLVHGMPFISGVGIEALQNKILTILQG